MMVIVRLVPYTAEQKTFLHKKWISLPEHSSSSSSSSSSSYNNSNVHEPRHSAQKRHQTLATGSERRVAGRGGNKNGKKKQKNKTKQRERWRTTKWKSDGAADDGDGGGGRRRIAEERKGASNTLNEAPVSCSE
jgi:hypothetical protein